MAKDKDPKEPAGRSRGRGDDAGKSANEIVEELRPASKPVDWFRDGKVTPAGK